MVRRPATGSTIMYRCELVRGERSGLLRGATGGMCELDRGAKGAVGCGEVGEQNGAWSPGFGPGDGKRLARGPGVEMARGVQSPLSARKRARISKARRRAASA